MKILLRLLNGLSLLACLAISVTGQTINLRMSVKIIVNPTNGAPPTGISPQTFTNAVSAANQWMSSYWRGYRFQLTEVTSIGGPSQGGASGPGQWFDINFRDDPLRAAFFSVARTDSRYLLRPDQINIYVATSFSAPGNSGGAMPIPPAETNYIGGQIFADDGAWWIVHELGHFFGLSHTFATQPNGSCTPGDDGIADTLTDSTCWTNRDQVAQYHFGAPYNSLNSSQKIQVDDVFFNVMSYHDYLNKNTTENRMTELQLDRHADHASGDRNAFVSGHTWFVDRGSTFPFPDGASTSYATVLGIPVGGPDPALSGGVSRATSSGGDIILLRPGNYNEQFTINKPLTLRATRAGPVTIGKP